MSKRLISIVVSNFMGSSTPLNFSEMRFTSDITTNVVKAIKDFLIEDFKLKKNDEDLEFEDILFFSRQRDNSYKMELVEFVPTAEIGDSDIPLDKKAILKTMKSAINHIDDNTAEFKVESVTCGGDFTTWYFLIKED